MFIDIKTFMLAILVAGILQTTMLYINFSINKKYQGPGYWTLASFFGVFGFLFSLLRDIDSVSLFFIVMSNLCLSLAMIFLYIGIMRFFHQRENRVVISIFLICYIVLMSYFIFINNSINTRIGIFSVANSIILFLIAWSIWTHRVGTLNLSEKFLLIITSATGGFFVFRAFYSQLIFPVNHFFSSASLQTSTFLVAFVFNFMWTAGVIILVTQRLNAEVRDMKLDLEQRNKDLVEQSALDGLTKIRNHRALNEYLKIEIISSKISGQTLSIAMFDLDNFKKINDNRGHLCGDQVLVEVARIMQDNVRASDVAGRYGGEEFMVIFSGTNDVVAKLIAERIRIKVEQHFAGDLGVTISGGIKEFEGETIADFIHAADMNLYEAKNKGRNRIV
ncbi:MAG: GGDEF domain-containing protein [Peptococcaceae bacterium]|nr:GGDEF domain-containing protein [Peptococcaceae bacterium]